MLRLIVRESSNIVMGHDKDSSIYFDDDTETESNHNEYKEEKIRLITSKYVTKEAEEKHASV